MNWKIGKITDISEEEYSKIYLSLSNSRKSHIDKMQKEEAKKSSLLATHLVNQLLEKSNIKNVLLQTDADRKPYLENSDLFVSISHSGEFVACAIDDKPIGIDIEKIKSVSDKLINFVCNEDEKEYVFENEFSDEEKFNRFFEIWTAKEAVFKKSKVQHNLCSTKVMNVDKQTFIIDGYYMTIV